MRTRNHDWYDSIKNVPVYGVQVFHEGKWKHASIGGKPIWCDTVEERDEQRKRLKRLLKLQEKMAMTANTSFTAPKVGITLQSLSAVK